MKKALLLANVLSAQGDVAHAESQLLKLMGELGPTLPRASKTTISTALEEAFEKLRAARKHLGVLEELASGSDDGAEDESIKK